MKGPMMILKLSIRRARSSTASCMRFMSPVAMHFWIGELVQLTPYLTHSTMDSSSCLMWQRHTTNTLEAMTTHSTGMESVKL
ncbi:hypothetical protein E2C01_007831 [Portunus trituberculatus]|uniref:Uncharacterized protein n=1 Tax=Portunus trituberculatus TaxID=210409 RepID=A0A5B7D0R0_PORTR|nr:hypothetical protein [Portunus trituberculatus]